MSDDLNLTGTGTPTPSPDPTPAPAISGTPAVTPAATPQGGSQSPATGGAPGEGWVPSYRLREAREAAQREAHQREQQIEARYQAQLQDQQRRLQVLAGVTPPDDPEIDQVRGQFSKLYPGLSELEKRAKDIFAVLERSGDLEAQTNHYWQTHGRQTMDRLFSHASESLGSPLTDEAKRTLHASFTGFVQSSPELTARYSSDPTLVEDFWKAFSSSFIEPARRATAAAAQGRAPGALPQDTPSGAPRTTPAPQGGSLDDRVNAAWNSYNTTRRA